MKWTIVLLSVLFGVDRAAADQFQMVPYYTAPGGTIITSVVFVFALNTADSFNCNAKFQSGNPVGMLSVQCFKNTVLLGTMPPGPALFSQNTNPNVIISAYIVWKIDQTTGEVTACGATNTSAQSIWRCGSASLPQR
jgi:hypothetical protein